LLQVKHLLKNFLISIEDIKNIVRLSKDGKITFDDVLEKYEDVKSILFSFSPSPLETLRK
jgi:hypothetical protein